MQYKVYYNGKEKGEASVFKENGRLTAEYSCPFEEGKIYKLYLGLNEGSMPLGIMLKNGGSFTYKRAINGKKAGQNGENIRCFYVEKHIRGSKATPPLPFDAESFTPCKWIDSPDHALQNCILEGGVLSFDFENTVYVAAKLEMGRAFPLAPFFCLATPVACEGKTLGVMTLDGKNIPTYLNKSDENQP